MSSTLPNTGRRPMEARAIFPVNTGAAATLPPAVANPAATSLAAQQRLQLTTAGPGDHPLVQRLLCLAGQAATAGEFYLQLEEPGYAPEERLVIRLSGDVVGHVRMSRREQRIGELTTPVAIVRELAVLPELRRLGVEGALVKAIMKKAAARGVQAVLWNTSAAALAQELGFVPVGSCTTSAARPRDVLANLAVAGHLQHDPHEVDVPLWPLHNAVKPLTIRWWRHYELAGLMRLYARQWPQGCGMFLRDDERWRWLISRHGYDRIYVAIDGPDSWELENTHPRLVGYAVLRETRIVELITDPERPDVAPQLLARACGDAVEQDSHRVHYEAPPGDPLHAYFAAATGTVQPILPTGEQWHVKLLQPELFLTRLCNELPHRLRGHPSSVSELGLHVDQHQWQLALAPRSVKFSTGKLGRDQLTLDLATFTKLALGTSATLTEHAAGRVFASSAVALELAEQLFTRHAWWLPAWEELPANA